MCINKISGGGGGVYFVEEFHGQLWELGWPDGVSAGDGGDNGERRKKEKRKEEKKKEGLGRRVIRSRTSTSLAP
jgi:hypothetical protein